MWFFLATINSEVCQLRHFGLPCPMASCEGYLDLVESKMVLRLFMVPVATFRAERWLKCDTCTYSRPYTDKDLEES
jgi:hypothetical protein